MRKIIKVDGTEVHFSNPMDINLINGLLNAELLDGFSLSDREHYAFVDDNGISKGLPVNDKGTQLYWQKCGGPNDNLILGDIYICPDSDYD